MKKRKGFTLVELIIAIAALSLICALVLKLFLLSGDLNDRAEFKQKAVLSASDIMEVIKAYDDIETMQKSSMFSKSIITTSEEINRYEFDTGDGSFAVVSFNRNKNKYFDIKIQIFNAEKMIFELNGGRYFKGERSNE